MGAWGEEVSLFHTVSQETQSLIKEQADRNDEHLDRKLDVLSKGIQSKSYASPGIDGANIKQYMKTQ